MRVATFNLENLGSRLGSPEEFRQRLNILRPQIERLNADVLCLQEINAQRVASTDGSPKGRRLEALERLLERTAYESFDLVASTHPATGYPAERHNLAILSRWDISESRQLLHDHVLPTVHTLATPTPARGARAITFDRPILYARVSIPGQPDLHVINLHLKAPLASSIEGQKSGHFSWKSASAWAEGYFLASQKRAGQALEARLLVDRLFDEDQNARIVVAGDFNAEQREVPARIIAAELEDTANGLLASRALVALEHGLPESRQFTVIHRGRKTMMDHLFVSRSLLAGFDEIEVHNEALGDELVAYAAVEDSPESYHAPIVATFR